MVSTIRKESRATARFQVELEIDFGSDSHFWAGKTMNLSEGGVFIASTELKPIGSEVDLTIRLPSPLAPVWARGEVKWIGEAGKSANAPLGMGVQFSMISDESLRAIREFLEKHRLPS